MYQSPALKPNAPEGEVARVDPVVTMSNAEPMVMRFWNAIYRRRWLVLALLVICNALGVAITLLMTPQYTAAAQIEISREQKNITKVEGLQSAEADRDVEFYKTQYTLLAARSLAVQVERALRLSSNPDFFRAHGIDPAKVGLTVNGAQGGTVLDQRRKRAVDLLLAHVNIRPIAVSRLVDVRYTSASPEISTLIANGWVKQFIEMGTRRRLDSTADARRILDNRLNDLAAKLQESERAVVRFAAEKNIVVVTTSRSSDGKTGVERTLTSIDLEALNAALAQATADRIAAQSRAASGGAATSDALSNNAVTALRQKRAEVAADKARLEVQFESSYPQVRALAEQLRVIDASIASELSRVNSGRAGAYREAVERERSLAAQVATLRRQIDQEQEASIRYNILRREADTNRQLYDSLLQRYKEIGVAGVDVQNVSIVDAADVPKRPSSPNLGLNLLLASIFGLGLASVVLFLLEQMDQGLRDPADIPLKLDLPLLGTIPRQADLDPIVALGDAKSELSEAYLSVRSALAFATSHGLPRSLMITSSRPSEGKSTTAIALAILIARTGGRVLLIDGDMRDPSVHSVFDRHNRLGLSNVLAGERDWKNCIQQSDVGQLDILAAGPTPPNAAELLMATTMAGAIREFEQMYDYIVVDAPPILGLADAPQLTRAVEGTVFVVEAGGVPLRGLRSALGRLRLVNATIFGVVLTKIKRESAQYGAYGYGYGYGLTYGRPSEKTT